MELSETRELRGQLQVSDGLSVRNLYCIMSEAGITFHSKDPMLVPYSASFINTSVDLPEPAYFNRVSLSRSRMNPKSFVIATSVDTFLECFCPSIEIRERWVRYYSFVENRPESFRKPTVIPYGTNFQLAPEKLRVATDFSDFISFPTPVSPNNSDMTGEVGKFAIERIIKNKNTEIDEKKHTGSIFPLEFLSCPKDENPTNNILPVHARNDRNAPSSDNYRGTSDTKISRFVKSSAMESCVFTDTHHSYPGTGQFMQDSSERSRSVSRSTAKIKEKQKNGLHMNRNKSPQMVFSMSNERVLKRLPKSLVPRARRQQSVIEKTEAIHSESSPLYDRSRSQIMVEQEQSIIVTRTRPRSKLVVEIPESSPNAANSLEMGWRRTRGREEGGRKIKIMESKNRGENQGIKRHVARDEPSVCGNFNKRKISSKLQNISESVCAVYAISHTFNLGGDDVADQCLPVKKIRSVSPLTVLTSNIKLPKGLSSRPRISFQKRCRNNFISQTPAKPLESWSDAPSGGRGGSPQSSPSPQFINPNRWATSVPKISLLNRNASDVQTSPKSPASIFSRSPRSPVNEIKSHRTSSSASSYKYLENSIRNGANIEVRVSDGMTIGIDTSMVKKIVTAKNKIVDPFNKSSDDRNSRHVDMHSLRSAHRINSASTDSSIIQRTDESDFTRSNKVDAVHEYISTVENIRKQYSKREREAAVKWSQQRRKRKQSRSPVNCPPFSRPISHSRLPSQSPERTGLLTRSGLVGRAEAVVGGFPLCRPSSLLNSSIDKSGRQKEDVVNATSKVQTSVLQNNVTPALQNNATNVFENSESSTVISDLSEFSYQAGDTTSSGSSACGSALTNLRVVPFVQGECRPRDRIRSPFLNFSTYDGVAEVGLRAGVLNETDKVPLTYNSITTHSPLTHHSLTTYLSIRSNGTN